MEKTIELRTNRLLLRQFRLEDVEDLLEYSNDHEWARYQINIPPHPYSKHEAESLVEMFSSPSAWRANRTGMPSWLSGIGLVQMFAIVFEGKVIGEIALNQQAEDRENERAEIGYALSRRHWGKGLMTEAAKAVTDWAFQTHSLNRLFACCDPRNVGSWRVMEKIGMRREGLLRSHVKWKAEYMDALYYGVLRGEWDSARNENATVQIS